MSKIDEKVAAAKAKAATKKQKGRKKMDEKAKRRGVGERRGTVAASCDPPVGRRGSAVAAAVMLCAAAMLCAGCALERADPAARSNRTTYGPISVVASGDGATASVTLGDGTIASADGEGAITQPATQTAEQSPDVTMPGDVAGAVVTGVAHLGGKAIDAWAAKGASDGGSGAGSAARTKAAHPSSDFASQSSSLRSSGDTSRGEADGAGCEGGDCGE